MRTIEPKNTLHMEKLARTTFGLTGITVVSRILGFLRDLIIAYILGGGAMAEALFAVLRLPNFVRRLTAEGCFSLPFIPEYLEQTHRNGEQSAMLFVRSTMLWVLLLTIPAGILIMCYPETIVLTLAPGFASQPQKIVNASLYLRFLLPHTIILCTLAVGTSVLQARRRFIPLQSFPAFPILPYH